MNDGKCALFIRTSVSGGIVSMSQMSRNLSSPRAEPVKRGLPTFSSLLSTVIWVKNCRSEKGLKQCLGGLKCRQNTKKNKKTLKVSFKAIFNVHFANLVSKEEGGVRVCGIAVLGHFWCGVAVIFISKYGIAVLRVQAVCGKFKFYAAVVGEKIVVSR